MSLSHLIILVLSLSLLGGFSYLLLSFKKNKPEDADKKIQESLQKSHEQLLSTMTHQFGALFKASASEVFQQQSQYLLNSAKDEFAKGGQIQKKEIEGLVKPLSESVSAYKKSLEEIEATRNKEYGSLDRILKSLIESNEKLGRETTHLANALKRPTVRGRWGEVQLRRIVELSGMTQNVDFEEQLSVDSDEGRLRPDMVIKLPGNREIVVDSKATLASYLDAESATTDLERKTHLSKHANSVRIRVQELSRRNYWDQFKQAPEFVVLFIPGEMFLSAALVELPDLLEEAFRQKVVLATPSTLMALMRAVSFGWRQEQLADNARKIGEHASRLYQALSVWTGHLSNMGQSLERTNKAFNAAVGSLERSVLPPARRMKELGVSSRDELSEIKEIESAPRTPATDIATEKTTEKTKEIATEEAAVEAINPDI